MRQTILSLLTVSVVPLMAAPPDQPHSERSAAPFAKEAQRYSDIAKHERTPPGRSPKQIAKPGALSKDEQAIQRNRVSASRTRLRTLKEKLQNAKRQAAVKTEGAAAAIARFLTLADSTFLDGVSLVEQKRLKDGWVKMLEVFDEIDQSRMHAYARDGLVHEVSDLCESCLGDFSVKVVPGGMEFYNFGNVTAADVYYYSFENRLLVRSQLSIRGPRNFVPLPNLATSAGRLEIHTSNTHRVYGWPDFRRIWPEGSTRGDSQFPTAHSHDDSVYRRAN